MTGDTVTNNTISNNTISNNTTSNNATPNNTQASNDMIIDKTILSRKQQLLILFATSLGVLINPLLDAMIIIALPNIGADFLVPARNLGWMSTAYILANAICLVPCAWFVDKIGYKKSFIIGNLIVAASAIVSVLSLNYPILIASRVVSAIGVSLLMVTSIAILARVFPINKRGFIIAINAAVIYIGLALGPVIGGVIIEAFSWRTVFMLVAPMHLVSGFILFMFMKTEFTIPVKKFDVSGVILYAISMFCLLYGLSTITDIGSPILAGAGLALFIFFIWHEFKKSNPILHVKLFFENRRFARSSYASLLHYSASYAVTYMLSLYLQSIGQLNAAEAGMILLFQPLIQLISTPIAGKLSDKIDAKYLVTFGMCLTVVGLLLISGIGIFTSNIVFYIPITQVFIGLGAALFYAPNTSAIMSSVHPNEYSMASSVASIVRQIGMLASMAICMAAISFFVGSSEMLGPEMYDGFLTALRVSMIIGTALGISGMLFSWFRGTAPKFAKHEMDE